MGAVELTNRNNPPDLDLLFNQISKKINGIRWKKKVTSICLGMLWFAVLFIAVGFLFVVLEVLFWFPQGVRFILVIFYLILLIFFGIYWLGFPLFSLLFRTKKPSDDCIALELGNRYPSVRDRLVDAIQVYRNRRMESERTSEQMAEKALALIFNEIRTIDFDIPSTLKKLASAGKYLCLVIVFSLIGSLFSLKTMWNGVYRMIHPWKTFEPASTFSILVNPGNVRVVQGETVSMYITVRGKAPEILSMVLIPENERSYEVNIKPPSIYRLESIRKNTKYFVRSGKIRSRTYAIDVLERPLVRVLQLVLYPPTYSRRTIRKLDSNNGDIEALAETQINLYARTNKEIQKAKLIFEDGNEVPMKQNEHDISGSFRVNRNTRYWIDLLDQDNLKNTDPIQYTIRIQKDGFPIARILSPMENVDLDERMAIPLVLEAEDDFGIQECRIGFFHSHINRGESTRNDTVRIPIPFVEKEPLRIVVRWTWKLESFKLLPGDVLSYFFEVCDNDKASGPKCARSIVHSAHFPSIEEIYREVEKEQNDQLRTLTEKYEEMQSFRDELKHLSEQMKAGKDLGWEEKKNLENRAEQQTQTIQQFDNLQLNLDDLVNRMENNNLVDLQTLQKYRELQKLFEEIATPEMMEMMRRFQDALKRVNETDLKKAMERLQFSQEMLLRSIERTVSLLKRIRIEQKMDELIKRIQNLNEKQRDIVSAVEGKNDTVSPDLVSKEDYVMKETDTFQKEAEKLHENMMELNQMPMKQMDGVIQSIQSPDLADEVEKMKTNLLDQNRSASFSQGTRIVQQMKGIEKSLSEMKQKIQREQYERLSDAMRKMSLEFLDLSQEQESLANSLKENTASKNENEQKQFSISQALDQKADSLYRLSQETMLVTPEIGKSLGEAKSAMQQSLQQLQIPDIGKSLVFQQQAIGFLNQTVVSMMKQMENMARGSGSGMEQYFLQLEGMGEEQAALNRRISQMLGRGELTLEQQSSMARLAAEQESLKNRLQKLIQEFGNRSDVIGRLDQLAKEMEKVTQELKNQKADQQTIQKQEQILSRFLEAQHSLYQQNFSQKRKARVGEDVIRKSPTPMQTQANKKLELLKQELLKAANEGYASDYIELIQKYFDAISRLNME